MKKIAMIPVALGSSRIENKNLVLVDGYPMIFYVIKACKQSNVFDEIYINSEEVIFEKIAKMLDVKFYKRDPNKGGSKCKMKNSSSDCNEKRCQVHDHFIMDFITNINCDLIFQIHTTSPLLKFETIKKFVEYFEKHDYDAMFSVKEVYEESFIDNKEINFDKNIKTKTQNLRPVQIINWAISAWKTDIFKSNYDIGPTFRGNIKLFPISKIESIDVDNLDDLYIADACLNHLKRKDNVGKFYFNKNIKSIENDLKNLIFKDGSPLPDKLNPNIDLTNWNQVRSIMGDGSWCYPIVLTNNDQCCMIQQQPGEGCRKHYHTTKDEWWIVLKGSFDWVINNDERIISASEVDIVFLPSGTVHQIICTSSQPGIRLAAGGRNMDHIYV